MQSGAKRTRSARSILYRRDSATRLNSPGRDAVMTGDLYLLRLILLHYCLRPDFAGTVRQPSALGLLCCGHNRSGCGGRERWFGRLFIQKSFAS
jgi:hypothetical protein